MANKVVKSTFIQISSIPLSLHEMQWDEEKQAFVDMNPQDQWEDWIGAHLRVRIHLSKDQEDRITDDHVKNVYYDAKSYQIERIYIPVERTRAAEIARAQTLPEKVKQWAETTEQTTSPEILTLAADVERSVTP